MMENKNLFYVTMLSLLGILAIFSLSLVNSSNLQGAIVWNRELSDVFHTECTEVDDPLKEFGVKGSVDFERYRYHDVCYGSKLFQVHCSSSVRVAMLHGYQCPNGCSDGACVR